MRLCCSHSTVLQAHYAADDAGTNGRLQGLREAARLVDQHADQSKGAVQEALKAAAKAIRELAGESPTAA
ncbi:MAG: hypothetical protein HY901_01145 [Deltaproteobacteria bacterium]|nr:hypothetical protein [Deltaproteobacteria bacterium]